VGITPGSVHDEHTWVLADSLGKCLRTFLNDDVAPTDLAWHRSVERSSLRIVTVGEFRYLDLLLEAGFSLMVCQNKAKLIFKGANYHLALDGAAVHSEIAQVAEKLLGTVLSLDELEEFGCVVDELKEAREFVPNTR
jgi:hypothetical protein